MQPRVLAVATVVQPHPLMLLPFVTMLLCALLPFILKDPLGGKLSSHCALSRHRRLLSLRDSQPERILRETGDYILFIAIPTS